MGSVEVSYRLDGNGDDGIDLEPKTLWLAQFSLARTCLLKNTADIKANTIDAPKLLAEHKAYSNLPLIYKTSYTFAFTVYTCTGSRKTGRWKFWMKITTNMFDTTKT